MLKKVSRKFNLNHTYNNNFYPIFSEIWLESMKQAWVCFIANYTLSIVRSNHQQRAYRPDKQNTQPSAVVAADDLPSCSTGHTAICCSWSFRIGPFEPTGKYWVWHCLLYSFGLVDYFVCAGGFFMVQTQPSLFKDFLFSSQSIKIN